jgi:multidrug efflux system membrane fusion protein
LTDPRVKRPWIQGAILGAALAVLGFSAGCGSEPQIAFERPPAPVTVADAVARDVPVYIDAVGKIAAREVVSIQPQVSGRITKIHFADGAEVKAGDLLFTIDPRPYQAQLHQAEANLAEAVAALSLAKINFSRVESVSDPRAVSRQDYDSKRNAVEAAEAVVKQNRAAVESARLNLEYATIRSPIDGRAGQRSVDAGNVVSANNGSLLVIQRLDPVYSEFTVTESQLSAVQDNVKKRTLRVQVTLRDEAAEPREGRLTFIDSSVQEGTGTVKLRATLANRDRRFWPGRLVNVRLILDTQNDAVLIPADGPQMSAKGAFVYVVKADSTAEFRSVTLGQRHGELIAIEKGVRAGERVVIQGQLGVTPGGKVSVGNPRSAAPAAQTGTKP